MRTPLGLLLLTLRAISHAGRMRGLTLFLSISLATPALAGGIQFMDDPTPPTRDDTGGTDHNLPIGCRYSPDELEEWARTQMPSVREAMWRFESRGYVRAAAADTAYNGCAQGFEGSVVTLTYIKPGAFIDSAHIVLPTIMVVSRRWNEQIETTVSGGLIALEGPTGRIFMADSLAQFAADGSFDIVKGGGSPRGRVGSEGIWDDVQNPRSRLSRWVRCTGWGSATCILTALAWGGPQYTPAKIALLLDAPIGGLGLLTMCLVVSGIGCHLGRM
jgi:hypothetical protein